MSSIRILSENVASQIAAGEVVERPASVVRELLDNSLDAGADRIEIRIEQGGIKLIRVSDNGQGMDRDDILLCVERHATSKVRELEDLFSIGTLGFRGEAIPSISSISRMEITSRTENEIIANRLRIHGGRLVSVEEAGAPRGTVVEVRDLFYNTPARRKFLRTPKTESHHVVEAVSRIALPFLCVYFRLADDKKTLLLFADSKNEIERLSMLFGRRVAERMELIEKSTQGLELRAHLAPAELSRSRGDRILVYVNGRNVRDRFVNRAVMEGYGQRLMKGRYPQVVVHLEMDSGLVDINVHPTKQEVRFRDGRMVYQAVVSALDGALSQPVVHYPAGEKEEPPGPFPGEAREQAEDYLPPQPVSDVRPEAGTPAQGSFQERPFLIIGQLRNTYILCQVEDGLLLVDQHAAHERIVFERLKRAMVENDIQSQPYLIPKSMDLSAKESRILEDNADALARMGLDVEHFGGNTFLLRALPLQLVNADIEEFFGELLAFLEKKVGKLQNYEAMEEMLAVMACHGAVRAGKPLSQREMVSLIDELLQTELSTNCPHGRPVSKKITWYEMERMFKRVV